MKRLAGLFDDTFRLEYATFHGMSRALANSYQDRYQSKITFAVCVRPPRGSSYGLCLSGAFQSLCSNGDRDGPQPLATPRDADRHHSHAARPTGGAEGARHRMCSQLARTRAADFAADFSVARRLRIVVFVVCTDPKAVVAHGFLARRFVGLRAKSVRCFFRVIFCRRRRALTGLSLSRWHNVFFWLFLSNRRRERCPR